MKDNENQDQERFRLIPEGELRCVWMMAGVLSYRLCDRGYDCARCALDRVMRGGGESAEGLSEAVEGFSLPGDLYFHQGHAWARVESRETATVGLDDFAQKLAGPIDRCRLPVAGAVLSQGERGWSLVAGGRELGMLSPLDGKVIAVNERLLEDPGAANADPYGSGWLVRVQSARLLAGLKSLLSGGLARAWLRKETEALLRRCDGELGTVLSDGGSLVCGVAQSLDPAHIEAIASEFFLTK